MDITKISIKRPVAIIMVMLIVIVLGGVSLSEMQLDLLPSMNIPVAIVMTQYTGAGPEEVEALVTKPLEGAAASVQNVESIMSVSAESMSVVVVQFLESTDMDSASLWLRERVDMVAAYLPEDTETPTIMKIDMNSMPIVYFTVASDTLSERELSAFAEDKIVPRIERQGGVATVDIMGMSEKEIIVEIDPERLEGLGLSMNTVSGLLAGENVNQPGGSVHYGDKTYSISSKLKLTSIEDVKRMPIPLSTGGVVALGDIATIREQEKESTSISRLNGENCLLLMATKASDANTVDTANAVVKEIEKIQGDYSNISAEVFMNQAEFIEMAIQGVMENILWGAVFAILILFVFLKNLRMTGVIAISMPLSIIGTFVLLYFSGITLNIVSLGGLSIGVGMLVDNSIVVLESIYRYRSDGYSPAEGTERGTKEVIGAIVGSTLTTVVIFVPFLFATGIVRSMFTPMALAVVFSLSMSLVAAVTIVPMMSANMVPDIHRTKFKRLRFLNSLMKGFDRIIKAITRFYDRVLPVFMRHKGKTILAILLIFIGSCALVPSIGAELIPAADQGSINITVSAPQASDLEIISDLAGQAEAYLMTVPEVETILTSTGSGVMSMMGGSSSASISVELIGKNERSRSSEDVAEQIREGLKNIAGAEISVSAASSIMGGSSFGTTGLSLVIYGDDLDTLKDLSDYMAVQLEQIEGLREISTSMDDPSSEIAIRVDRDKARQYGLTGAQIGAAVRATIQGTVATTLKAEGTETDIRLKYPDAAVRDFNDLGNVTIATPYGGNVPLSTLAEIAVEDSPTSIYGENQSRYVTISADIYNRDIAAVQSDVDRLVAKMNIPVGYTIEHSGQVEMMEENFQTLFLAIALAILLVYMVMAAQFESLLYPFVIMFTIPLALMGVFFLLFITNQTITMISLIGILILVGIVVNNGIVLVDYIGILRERDGLPVEEAILKACPVRLRPILMTALTTVLGQLPIVFSNAEASEMLKGMGITVVGGLMASTVLTLVVVPILYTYFTNLSNRFKKRTRRGEKKQGVARIEHEC